MKHTRKFYGSLDERPCAKLDDQGSNPIEGISYVRCMYLNHSTRCLKGDGGGVYMALGNCIHMFQPYFGPHQYSVNQLWLFDVFTAKTTV